MVKDDFDPFEVFDWQKQPWRWSSAQEVTTHAESHHLADFEANYRPEDIDRVQAWLDDPCRDLGVRIDVSSHTAFILEMGARRYETIKRILAVKGLVRRPKVSDEDPVRNNQRGVAAEVAVCLHYGFKPEDFVLCDTFSSPDLTLPGIGTIEVKTTNCNRPGKSRNRNWVCAANLDKPDRGKALGADYAVLVWPIGGRVMRIVGFLTKAQYDEVVTSRTLVRDPAWFVPHTEFRSITGLTRRLGKAQHDDGIRIGAGAGRGGTHGTPGTLQRRDHSEGDLWTSAPAQRGHDGTGGRGDQHGLWDDAS